MINKILMFFVIRNTLNVLILTLIIPYFYQRFIDFCITYLFLLHYTFHYFPTMIFVY